MLGLILMISLVLMVVLARNIRIVPQTSVFIIERLGTYSGAWSAGMHFKLPVLDRIAAKISMKEQVADFKPQPVITKDNVTMMIDTVVYYIVSDPKLYAYGIANPIQAIENLTATTLRNIVGDLDLDQTLTSRDIINTKMRSILDEATDAWGIKINRVELKNIVPPETIRISMEKQMKAERERRESILQAEGQKQSEITIAEGNKQAVILTAEGDKISKILRAEAEKEAAILKAQGEAEAIREVQRATADGIVMINKSEPSQQVLTLNGLEALAKIADGQSTKMIIPFDLQNVASMVGAVTEIGKMVVDDPSVKVEKETQTNNSFDGWDSYQDR